MRIIYFIILLLIFLPVVIKEYQKDKGLFKKAKILNLAFSSVVFFMFISTVKVEISNILSNYETILADEFVEYGVLNPLISGISWILYVIIFTVISFLLISIILRKDKSRRFLLKTIPMFFIVNSIQLYKFGIIQDDELTHSAYFLPIVFVTNAIICVVIYLFYSNKGIKKLFHPDHARLY